MFNKKIFSLLGLLFIGNRIDSVLSASADCNVKEPKDCLINTYYLVNSNNPSEVINDGNGSLYYCSGETQITCEEQSRIGYYAVDKETVYVCRYENGKSTCTKETVISNTCESIWDIGKIYPKDESTLAFCLNYNTEASIVELNSNSNGNYLVYKNSNPDLNIFGITGTNENYAIVGIQDKVVTLNSTYSNGLKYVYADKTNNKVMVKGDKSFPKDGTTNEPDESKIMELLCSSGKCKDSDMEISLDSGLVSGGGIKLLKLNASNQLVALDASDLSNSATFASVKSNIRLFNCDTSGNCEKTSGYYYANSKYIIVTMAGADDVPGYDSRQNCKGKEGLLYKDTVENKFYLCLDQDLDVDVTTPTAKNYVIASGKTGSPFLGASNKILKLTTTSITIDNTFTAENNKNYVIEIGTGKFYSYRYDESNSGFLRDSELSGVKNYDLHGAGLNIYDEYPLKDTKSISAAVSTWKLFNCKHGECLQTYGYMKSQNEEKYFKYYADGTTPNAMLTTGFAQCSTDGENGLMSNGKLCITHGNDSTRVTGDMTNGNIFVVHTANGDPFYKTSAADLLLEATSNSITISNIYEGRSGILTHKNQKILSGSITEDTEGNYEKLILYDCEKTGSCKRVGGYAINGSKIYSVLKTDSSSKSSIKYNNGVITEVSACSSASSGKIVKIGAENYLCLDNTNKVKLTDYGYYALGNDAFDSGSPFDSASDKKKMIKITGDLIAFDHAFDDYAKCVIKNDNKYEAYEQSTGTYTLNLEENGIKVYEAIDSTNIFTVVTSPETTTEETNIGSWALFDCTNGACDRTYGYFKSGSNVLAISYQEYSNTLLTPTIMATKTCTESSNVGNILTDGKLCVINNSDSESQKTYDMADDVRYALSNSNSNIFAPSSQGSLLIIKGTVKSFTLSTVDKYNVVSVDKGTGEVGDPDYSDNTSKANVSILKCSEGNICNRVSGYTKDASDNYYSINVSTGASSENPTESTCSSSNAGSIILKGGIKILCLGSGSSIQIPEGKGRFVLGTASSGVLTTGKLININPNYIVVDDVIEGNTDANYLINFNGGVYIAYKYTKNTGIYSINTNVNGMKTYQKIDNKEGTNILKEVTDIANDIHLVDLSTLSLFQCEGGRCAEMQGYVFVGGKIHKCNNGNCSNDVPAEEKVTAEACNALTAVGKVIETSTKIQLCMYGVTPAVADVSNSDTYYLGPDATHIKKYIGNNENNIIALPKPEIGYFLVNNYKISTTGNIIKCDGGENCIKMDTTANCATDIGKFNSDKKLCLAANKASAAIGTNGSYIMSYDRNSAFWSILKTSGTTKLLIKMDTESITVDTSMTSICVNDDTLAATAKSGSCATGSTEYTCNTSGLCIQGGSALVQSTEKKLEACHAGCSGETTERGTKTYCIDTDKKIYPIDDQNKCKGSGVLAEGAHLFKISNPASDITEITKTTGKIISTEAEDLALYQCNSSKECKQVEGYVKLVTYTELQNEPSNWASIYTSYYSDTSDAAASTTWTPPVYSKNENSYYYVTKNGALSTGSSFSSTCNASDVGKISSSGVICISSGKTVNFGTNAKQYLVTNGSAQWYMEFNTDYIIKTQISGTLVSGANVFNTEKLELVNYSSTSNENLTAAKNNLVLYNCDVSVGKLCLQSIGYIKSSDGKFEISDNNPGTKNKASTGYECNTSGKLGALSNNAAKLCVIKGTSNENDAKLAEFDNGYYYIASPATESIFTGKTGAIVRTADTFMILDNLFGNSGAKTPVVINTDTMKEQSVGIDLESNSGKLKLYECAEGQCTLTVGFIHGTGSNYYEAKASTTASAKFTLITSCAKNVGKMKTDGKFCISSVDEEAVPLTTNNDYIIHDGSGFKYVRIVENIASISSITGEIDNGVNRINTETATVIAHGTNTELQTALSDDLSKLALYYCNKNTGKEICKRTYGYFKTSDSTYYSVSPTETSVLSLASSCSSSNIGLLFTGYKLCLTGAAGDSLTFDGNNYNYQLKSALPIAEGNAFSPENNLDLVIEIAANTIAVNPIYYRTLSEGINILYVGATDKKITDSTDISGATIPATDVPSIQIYGCTDSKCVRTYGYIQDAAKKYAIKNGAANAEVSSAVANCNTIGLLYTDFKLCVDSNTANVVAFIADIAIGNYIINAPADNVFTNTASNSILIRASKSVFVLNNFEVEEGEKYILKEGEDYHQYIYSSGLMTKVTSATDVGSYDLITSTDDTFYRVADLTDTSIYADSAKVAKVALFDCDANGACTQEYGYYKADSRYFKIGADSNALVDSTQCSAIGLLLNTGKLCITSGSETTGLDFATGNNIIEYLISDLASTNAFIGSGTGIAIVKATANYIILEKKVGISLLKFDSTTSILTDFTAGDCTSNPTKVTLLDCKSTGICTKVPGFVKDTNYYTVAASGGASELSGDNAEVTLEAVTGTGHCNSKVGKIGTNGGKKYLCLTADLSIDLSTTGNFVIGTPTANTILAGNTNKMLIVTDTYIAVDSTVTGTDESFLVKMGNTYRVYTYGEGTFTAGTDKIGTFQGYKGHPNVLIEVMDPTLQTFTSKADLAGVKTFKCVGGICSEAQGYVLAGTGAGEKIYENFSTPGTWNDVTPSTTCTTAADHAGGVQIDSSKIQLCMPTTGTAAAFGAVVNTSTYLFGKTAATFKVYNGNGSTSTIVIVENPVAGYYMTTAAGVIETATGEKTGDLLVTCVDSSGISCSTTVTNAVSSANAGYYLNNADNKSLILCTATANCQLKSEDSDVKNVSYIGNGGILISCDGSNVCSNPTTASGDKYVVKVGADFKIYESDGTKLTLVESARIETYNQDATYTTLSKQVDLTSTAPSASTKLFDCKADGSCKETYGYYMPTTGRYLKISKTPAENTVVADNISSCTAVGDLLSGGKLCAQATGNGDIDMPDEATKYIIGTSETKVAAANIFTKSEETAIIIKATAKSFTLDLDNAANTDYCKDTSNVATLKGEGACASGAGCCGTEGTCTTAACS